MPFVVTAQVLPGPSVTLTLERGKETPVADVKALVGEKVQSCAGKPLLVVHRGKKLADEDTIGSHGITNGEKIFVAISPESGKAKQQGDASKAGREEQKDAKDQKEATEATAPASGGFDILILVVGKGKETVHLPEGENTKVEDLQQLVAQRHPDVPVDSQTLAANGKRLQPGDTLRNYNIKKKQTIYVARRGGGTSSGATSSSSSAAQQPQTSSDDPRSADDIAKEVMTHLSTLKRSVTRDEFIKGVQRFAKLLGNLADHPDVHKYKRVRENNETLQRDLFRHPGGLDAVKAVGFRESEEEPGSLFVRSPSPHLRRVYQLLKDAMSKQNITLPGDESRPPLGFPFAPPWAPPSSSSSSSPSPSSAPMAGQGGPSPFSLMQDPMARELLSNPQMMETMLPQAQRLMSDPQMMQQAMQQMAQDPQFANNPMISHLLQNPEAMQRMSTMASQLSANPEMMRAMMGGMGGMGGMGQGMGGMGQGMGGMGQGMGGGMGMPGQQPQQGQQQQPQGQGQQQQPQGQGQQQQPQGQPGSGQSGGSLQAQEDAMLQEAIRRSMMDQGGSSGSGGDSKDGNNDSAGSGGN